MSRSIVIKSTEGVESVKRIQNLLLELGERKQVIQAKAEAEYAAVQSEIGNEIQVLWQLMLEEAKIPQEERHCYYLNTEFFREHGLAFIMQNEEKAAQFAFIQSKFLNPDDVN